MIGTIVSLHYVGKKKWMMSIVFWIVYLVSMAILGAILNYIVPAWTTVSIVGSAAVFIILANKWYKFSWMNALKLFAVALIIDLIIVFVVLAALVAVFGFVLPSWLGGTLFVGLKL